LDVAELLKCPLTLTQQPEGGFTVTSPVLPELVTEGDTVEEALEHVQDALRAVVELYEDLGKDLPDSVRQDPSSATISFESLVSCP
jgi:antitoxin HicB